MSEFSDEIDDYFGRGVSKVLATIGVVILVYLGVSFFWSLWPFSVARDVAHKTTNATYLITNYNWYHDQYASIQAQIANIQNTPKEDSTRRGMIMVVNSQIAEYNARSREITRNMWKDSSLPQTLNFYNESN